MTGRRRGRNPSLVRALLAASFFVIPLIVLLSPSEAHAYAWMLKHGYSGCPVCHADPSGGELLTTYGRAQSAFFLSMRWKKEPKAEKAKDGGGSKGKSDFDSFDSFDDDSSSSSDDSATSGDEASEPEAKPKKKKHKKSEEADEADASESEDADEDPQKMKGKQAGKKIIPEKINLDEEEPEEKPKPKPKAVAPKAKEEKPVKEEKEEEEPKPKPKAKPVEEPKAKAEPEEDKGEGEDAEESEDEDADTKAAASEGAEAEAEAETEASAEPEEPTMFSDFLFGLVRLPPWLLLGGSYRHMNILTPSGAEVFRTFPMQMDLYGQMQFGIFRANASIGAAKVPEGSPFARAAQVTTGQGDQWNLISRVHWLGVDLANNLVTVRAGRMNLPFGVRIPEHTMWVRQKTRTDRESGQQHGVAASYNGELLRGEIMAIAGNYQINPDEFRERGYSAYAEYLVTPKIALGLSSLVTSAANDRVDPEGEGVLRQVHGAMTRAVLSEKVVLLGEADLMLKSRTSVGYVGFLQGDYEPIQGLHFLVTGEFLDQGFPEDETVRSPGIGKPKLGAWLSANWFFLPHFDARIDALMRQSEPFTLLAQLHLYL